MPPMPPPMPPPGPRPPRPRPIYRIPIVYVNRNTCRPIYSNQRAIDGLNAILAGCNNLSLATGLKCDSGFIKRVEKELATQLSIGVYIGTNCNAPTLY